ncbi:hypothetical protein WM94_11015 [Pseudomonas sp. ABFPK]|nr:hypothetical protein WM94_10965 [Pseudomonas sp. ABFPK]KYC23206.1 hypothetical protein WM94_11015 [Pseudomonas sp. ABFPK]
MKKFAFNRVKQSTGLSDKLNGFIPGNVLHSHRKRTRHAIAQDKIQTTIICQHLESVRNLNCLEVERQWLRAVVRMH